MSKRVGFTPLPEVNERSEVVQLGELGLPVGFDLERLELHVARTERIARLSDLGTLMIKGFRGDATEYTYGVGSMSSDGSATATKVSVITKADLHDADGEVNDMTLPPHYRWADGSLSINNAELEQRIQNDGDKWHLGVFDVRARSKYMDRALRAGLTEVATQVQIGEDMTGALLKSMALKSMDVSFFWHFLVPGSYKFAFALSTIADVIDAPVDHFVLKKGIKKASLPERQWSMFHRTHYDRYVAALGLIRASRLIRARS